MEPVSVLTWLVTPLASWSSADRCALRLAAALDTSLERGEAEGKTSSRSELSVGLASSAEKELKNPVRSLPMSPALALDDPESGVNRACMVFNAVNRGLEEEASCCC